MCLTRTRKEVAFYGAPSIKGHPLKTTKIFATIAIAAISVSALAGCVSTPEVDVARSSATATPKPSAEPVVETLVGDYDGNGSVSEAEKARLARENYELPDGTTVPIVKGEALPAVVIEAMEASVRAQAGPAVNGGTIEQRSDHANAAMAAVEAEGAKVGVILIPVSYAYDGMVGGMVWAVGGPAAGYVDVFDTEAKAVAAAEAWIAPKNEVRAGGYAVIVLR